MDSKNNKIDVLDHGFVRLIDVMGDDASIVQSARVSYGKGTKTVNEDRGLIRYLMRNRHTSPLEMGEVKLHWRLPIFVARQAVRHRTAQINEYSARYSIMSDDFYLPALERVQGQSKSNKQGSEDIDLPPEAKNEVLDIIRRNGQQQYADYQRLLEIGVSRELARVVLGTFFYTEWYLKINLHNLFHFLHLRMDAHAQYEIRVYADAIYKLVQPHFPLCFEAFDDYRRKATSLSSEEFEIIKDVLKQFPDARHVMEARLKEDEKLSPREKKEIKEKFIL